MTVVAWLVGRRLPSTALAATCALLVALFSPGSGSLRPPAAAAAGAFTVTSAVDAVDAAPGDGACVTVTGACTLRAAVQEANALAGADTILFASSLDGTPITLTVVGTGEDAAARGDLDVVGTLTVTGNGADATIVQGCDASTNPACRGVDRLFDVLDGAGLTLNAVTVRNGYAADGAFSRVGGALRVGQRLPWEGGNGVGSALVLNGSRVLNSAAVGDGGGIVSIGTLAINGSVVAGNAALADGSGGGVANILGSRLTITNSTISGNTAGWGGGLYNNPGSLPASITVTDSSISGNTATTGVGGGVFQNGPSDVSLTNSTVSGNRAATRGGGLYATGMSLASVTVAGNTADFDGNGDGDGGGVFGSATLKNSIVARNADASAAPGAARHPDCSGALASAGYNLIGDGSGPRTRADGADTARRVRARGPCAGWEDHHTGGSGDPDAAGASAVTLPRVLDPPRPRSSSRSTAGRWAACRGNGGTP